MLAAVTLVLGPLIDEAVLLPDRISPWNQISTGNPGAIPLSAIASASRSGKFF
jgi:hypothetical protein